MMFHRIRPIQRLRLAGYQVFDASVETVDRLLSDQRFVIAFGIAIVAIIIALIIIL